MPSLTDSIGRVLGDRYRLVTAVGTGASAHVYLADDVSLHRQVAIKVLHPALAGDQAFLKRFRAEARAVAALNHPNILRVYDWGEEDGEPYLVLEYLAGGSLRQIYDTGDAAHPRAGRPDRHRGLRRPRLRPPPRPHPPGHQAGQPALRRRRPAAHRRLRPGPGPGRGGLDRARRRHPGHGPLRRPRAGRGLGPRRQGRRLRAGPGALRGRHRRVALHRRHHGRHPDGPAGRPAARARGPRPAGRGPRLGRRPRPGRALRRRPVRRRSWPSWPPPCPSPHPCPWSTPDREEEDPFLLAAAVGPDRRLRATRPTRRARPRPSRVRRPDRAGRARPAPRPPPRRASTSAARRTGAGRRRRRWPWVVALVRRWWRPWWPPASPGPSQAKVFTPSSPVPVLVGRTLPAATAAARRRSTSTCRVTGPDAVDHRAGRLGGQPAADGPHRAAPAPRSSRARPSPWWSPPGLPLVAIPDLASFSNCHDAVPGPGRRPPGRGVPARRRRSTARRSPAGAIIGTTPDRPRPLRLDGDHHHLEGPRPGGRCPR